METVLEPVPWPVLSLLSVPWVSHAAPNANIRRIARANNEYEAFLYLEMMIILLFLFTSFDT